MFLTAIYEYLCINFFVYSFAYFKYFACFVHSIPLQVSTIGKVCLVFLLFLSETVGSYCFLLFKTLRGGGGGRGMYCLHE